MMHGNLNPDRLCKLIEQIYNERDDNFKYKVDLIDKEDDKEDKTKSTSE